MRIKLDENLSRHLKAPLMQEGHDVATVADENLLSRPDVEVAAAARAERMAGVRSSLLMLMRMVQQADAAPATQLVSAVAARRQAVAPLLARWNELKTKDLPALNEQLRNVNLPELRP